MHQFHRQTLSHAYTGKIKSDQAEIALKGVNILTKPLFSVVMLTGSATLSLLSGSDKRTSQASLGCLWGTGPRKSHLPYGSGFQFTAGLADAKTMEE